MNTSRRREIVARLEWLARDCLAGWKRLRDLPDIAVLRQTAARSPRANRESVER